MPSNIISINRSQSLEWEIPDSRMAEVMFVLDRCGYKRDGNICLDPTFPDVFVADNIK